MLGLCGKVNKNIPKVQISTQSHCIMVIELPNRNVLEANLMVHS